MVVGIVGTRWVPVGFAKSPCRHGPAPMENESGNPLYSVRRYFYLEPMKIAGVLRVLGLVLWVEELRVLVR
jgi:hypothetical protein